MIVLTFTDHSLFEGDVVFEFCFESSDFTGECFGDVISVSNRATPNPNGMSEDEQVAECFALMYFC